MALTFEDLRNRKYLVKPNNTAHLWREAHKDTECNAVMGGLDPKEYRVRDKLGQSFRLCKDCREVWLGHTRHVLGNKMFLCGNHVRLVTQVSDEQVVSQVVAGGMERTHSKLYVDALKAFLDLIVTEVSNCWNLALHRSDKRSKPRTCVWFYKEHPSEWSQRCRGCGERTNSRYLDAEGYCQFCEWFSQLRGDAMTATESAEALMRVLWRVVERSAPGMSRAAALDGIIERWATDLAAAETVTRHVQATTLMLRVAVAAEMTLAQQAQPRVIERLREMGPYGMIEVIKQLYSEGHFTLDEIDPPPMALLQDEIQSSTAQPQPPQSSF